MYQIRESDRHFFLSLFVATGIVLFWRGIWEGVGSLPILEEPFVNLFIGLVILTFSGMIVRDYDPLGGLEKSTLKILHSIHTHPQKSEFSFRYYDNVKKKSIEVQASKIKHIEKNVIAVYDKDREFFIPIHRVESVHRNKETIWRL
jgi:hypothetical protein